jgi:hypothetical protein
LCSRAGDAFAPVGRRSVRVQRRGGLSRHGWPHAVGAVMTAGGNRLQIHIEVQDLINEDGIRTVRIFFARKLVAVTSQPIFRPVTVCKATLGWLRFRWPPLDLNSTKVHRQTICRWAACKRGNWPALSRYRQRPAQTTLSYGYGIENPWPNGFVSGATAGLPPWVIVTLDHFQPDCAGQMVYLSVSSHDPRVTDVPLSAIMP